MAAEEGGNIRIFVDGVISDESDTDSLEFNEVNILVFQNIPHFLHFLASYRWRKTWGAGSSLKANFCRFMGTWFDGSPGNENKTVIRKIFCKFFCFFGKASAMEEKLKQLEVMFTFFFADVWSKKNKLSKKSYNFKFKQ